MAPMATGSLLLIAVLNPIIPNCAKIPALILSPPCLTKAWATSCPITAASPASPSVYFRMPVYTATFPPGSAKALTTLSASMRLLPFIIFSICDLSDPLPHPPDPIHALFIFRQFCLLQGLFIGGQAHLYLHRFGYQDELGPACDRCGLTGREHQGEKGKKDCKYRQSSLYSFHILSSIAARRGIRDSGCIAEMAIASNRRHNALTSSGST